MPARLDASSLNDAWIAALASQHQLPVLSRDPRLDVVPDLKRAS
jgi:predicted nucleic acid-binding protein